MKLREGLYAVTCVEQSMSRSGRVGNSLLFMMDTVENITVRFLTRDLLEYAQGDKTWREKYECAKGAEEAYFVNFELTGVTPRTNITLLLDTRTRLVSVVNTWTGLKKE